ncbi:DUF1501 domain-containing protein [uncultured Winogradskyella sp.]|uniref:DUF1501 domain-containing protein n=1 Tax=uncultured Winogradskyella sp. TaxID=395353 RepID=UPI00261F72E8|nr:DUF1501 domain-containing protein [uncultured Winogradskyella sp.]
MKRRKFIGLGSSAVAGSFLLNGHIANAFQYAPFMDDFNCDATNDRVMVIIQLKGGNDGLNTAIPLGRFDTYANLRPNIYIPNTGPNGIINLDTSLATEAQVGLHPSMTAMKGLYDSGEMGMIQSVGYPDHNRSHFKSTDLWLSGGDGTPEGFNISDGWMARYLENAFEPSNFQDPLGVQLGSKNNSLGFHTEEEHTISINLTGQDPGGFYSLISGIGAETPLNIPNSDFGDILEHIIQVENGVNTYAQRITDVFNAGQNQYTSYPDTDLANQLKTIARLMSGGSQTKVFLANLGGFDTHRDQVVDGNTSVGDHAELLLELSEAIHAFQQDLKLIGIDERVVTFTFSEFGRKVSQNGNFGTDHGNFAPLFVCGTNINAGVLGVNPNIDDLADNDQLQDLQFDYRQVFTTFIQDWMGGSDTILNSTFYQDFSEDKLPLIKPAAVVAEACYNESLGLPEDIITTKQFAAYPNPFKENLYVELQSEHSVNCRLQLYNLEGRTVYDRQVRLSNSAKTLDLSYLPSGVYVMVAIDGKQLIGKEKVIKN